jgi:nucleotide-binding universal stress UspA family protein
MATSRVILCATDFSEWADKAVEYASLAAHESGAKLVLVHVVSPNEDAQLVDREIQLRAVPGPVDVACDRILRSGDPADVIKQVAAEVAATQIVIGTHGQPESHGVAMGSVAQHIVDRAPCAVTVVRDESPHSTANEGGAPQMA